MDKYIFYLFVFFFVLFAVYGHEEQRRTDSVAKLEHLLNSKTGVTYRLTQDGKSCTKPGLMCEDCTKVSYCIQMPGGNWLKEDMEDCPSGSTCLESSGTCTTESNPSCEGSVPGYEFTCHQPGIFPDPFNCQRYHMCIPGNQIEVVKTSIKMKCDNSFYYDPLTTLCRKKIEGGKCPFITMNCTTSGQSGVIIQNPSLYYICLKTGSLYFPQIFACPYNEYYYDATKSCKDPTPPSHISCKVPGRFYDPVNCKQYYECSNVGAVASYNKCDNAGTLIYDPVYQKCTTFSCSDIKDRW